MILQEAGEDGVGCFFVGDGGVLSGSDLASFERIFGPCRRMALPVGRRFCGGYRITQFQD